MTKILTGSWWTNEHKDRHANILQCVTSIDITFSNDIFNNVQGEDRRARIKESINDCV